LSIAASATLLAWSIGSGNVSTAPAAKPAEIVKVRLSGEGGGSMSIKLDRSSVPAGQVSFHVTNEAISQTHELIIVALASPGEGLPYDAGKERVESKIRHLGEVADLKPGASETLSLMLRPGAYALICSRKGHSMAGMATPFAVTGN
jgi:uncharacterized cupredoxin-like copper-binding protein